MNKHWEQKLIDVVRVKQRVDKRAKFGVEIECEGNGRQHLPNMVYGWNCIPDGSLRGHSMEYVTIGAVDRDKLDVLTKIIGDVTEGIVKKDAHRASTHIHYNMQQKTFREIMGAIICFQMIEPVFMRLCGPNRDGNLFCLPSYDCGDMPEHLKEMAKHIEIHGTLAHIGQRGKYASLNLNPLTKFGTLEFRTFPCSTDPSTLMKWADRVDMLIQRGGAMRSFKFEVERFFEQPMNIYQDVFTPREMDVFTPREIMEMTEHGAESAWDCAIAVEQGIKKAEEYLKDLEKANKAQEDYLRMQQKAAVGAGNEYVAVPWEVDFEPDDDLL